MLYSRGFHSYPVCVSDKLGYNFTVFILKTKPLKGRSAAPGPRRDIDHLVAVQGGIYYCLSVFDVEKDASKTKLLV